MSARIDFHKLLKLRLVVARHGEMDGAKWWNTNGVLGRQGGLLLSRGLPRSHRFAQARIVFAVAKARCHEVFDPPGCMTLWSLPATLEDEFDAHWQDWIDHRDEWAEFFTALESLPSHDLVENLRHFELIDDATEAEVTKLRRAAEGKSVPLSGTHEPNDEVFRLLAAGFARGEVSKPAVPYAKLAG